MTKCMRVVGNSGEIPVGYGGGLNPPLPTNFMKCEVNEYEDTFHCKFIPETVAEASLLGRIGFTRTKKTEVQVYFSKESPTMSVWIGKGKTKFPSI